MPTLAAALGAALAISDVAGAQSRWQAQSQRPSGEWRIVWQPRDGHARTLSDTMHLSLAACEREVAAMRVADEKLRREALTRANALSRDEWQALNTRSEAVSTAVCVRR